MNYLSQNKKIAISALAIFLMSLSSLMFFLESNGGHDSSSGQANIFKSEHADEDKSEDENKIDNLESIYREELGDFDNPIFAIDTNSRLDFVSESFCKMLSKRCETLLGKSFYDYINVKDLPDFVFAHTGLIQEPKLTEGIGPFRMITSEGEMLVLLKAFPILSAESRIIKIVFSVKDITTQAEELNYGEETDNGKNGSEEKDANDNWIKALYPKIKDVKGDQDMRMVVDKISFKGKE